MRVKKQSPKGKRAADRSRYKQIRFHPYLMSQESEQTESDESETFRGEPVTKARAIPGHTIRTSQQAGPSTAGPVIVESNSEIPRVTVRTTIIEPVFSSQETQIITPVLSEEFQIPIDNPDQLHIKFGLSFDKIMRSIEWKSCSNCLRSFPDLKLNKDKCCSACAPIRLAKLSAEQQAPYMQKYTKYNNMDPGEVPVQLQDLTFIEELLIARVHPIIRLYRIRGQQFGYTGNVINFRQDIGSFFNKLPNINAVSQAVILISKETLNGCTHFRVRVDKVRRAILWLKTNHRYYRDVEIDEQTLTQLPDDGDITEILSQIPSTFPETLQNRKEPSETANEFTESFFPVIDQLDQESNIRRKIASTTKWPSLEPTPISEFTEEGYIACAFPALFPYGDADFLQPRTYKLSWNDYFRFLLQYKDGRFAKHPRFRFFAANTEMRMKALSMGDVFIKRAALQNISKEDLETMLDNDKNFADKIMFYAGRLRTSRSYWGQRSGELLDMVNQIGSPTIFLTLSAADYHWPDLFRLLTDADPDSLTSQQRAKLMHDNPVITAYFFTRRAETFIKEVIKSLFDVKDFWFRYEWQWRGSPHVHGLLWLNDAPDFEKLDNASQEQKDEMAKYCENICTAVHPAQNLYVPNDKPCRKRFTEQIHDQNDLPRLLNNCQRHTQCGDHCLRKQRGSSDFKCRFEFPQELVEKGYFCKENNIWRYKPTRNDELLQRYHPLITRIWRGNTDFSPVVSKQAVLNYIAKYASKAEHASPSYSDLLKDLISSDHENQPKKVIKKLMMSTAAERDYSAQEIAHYLLGWPLFRSSKGFITVTIKDEEWIHLLHEESQKDASIITRYKNREAELNDICLYEFAKNYIYKKKENKNVYTGRNAIVRVFPRIKQTGEPTEDEKFFKITAILYIPWKNDYQSLISSVCGDNLPWAKICSIHRENTRYFLDFPEDNDEFLPDDLEDPHRVHEDPYMAVSKAGPREEEIVPLGQRQVDVAHEWESLDIPSEQVLRLKNWLDEIKQQGLLQHATPTQNQYSLSIDQKAVMRTLKNQISDISKGRQPKIKRVMVQGKAGCGKSFLIGKIRQYCTNVLGGDSIEVLAPTGVAAVNINGKTLHSFLRFSAFNQGPLRGEDQRKFQNQLRKRKVLIFDEMSMIGLKMIKKIDDRLREGMGIADIPFGGLVVYFFGDLRQLPPVLDTALFNPNPMNDTARLGKLVIDSFQDFFLLSSNHRQNGSEQQEFRNMLDSIAYNKLSKEHWDILVSRRRANMDAREIQRFKHSVRLYPTRQRVEEYNTACLASSGNPIAHIPAVNKPHKGVEPTDEIAQQLPNMLYLSIGCRVMLRRNLWTEGGLVNGSIGTVRRIIYHNNRPPSLPVCVFVEFDNYNGPFYEDKLVPILPITRSWQSKGVECARTQLPICLAHAITIHKSQGLTLNHVVVDLSSNLKPTGLVYVALSRVKTLQGLMLESCADYEKFTPIDKNILYRESFLNKFNSI